MRTFAAFLVLAACAAAADKPRVTRVMIDGVERSFDRALGSVDVNDPFDLLGQSRGVYLPGYGAVFTCEVNLVVTSISPFYPALTSADLLKLHAKKLQRLGVLKSLMRKEMTGWAAELETVPPNEQVVLGVTLFYRSFENREGLPSQIVMQATRQALLDFKANRITAAQLDQLTQVQEL
jgi:hypothetical protein